jgi:hypothetical protein
MVEVMTRLLLVLRSIFVTASQHSAVSRLFFPMMGHLYRPLRAHRAPIGSNRRDVYFRFDDTGLAHGKVAQVPRKYTAARLLALTRTARRWLRVYQREPVGSLSDSDTSLAGALPKLPYTTS